MTFAQYLTITLTGGTSVGTWREYLLASNVGLLKDRLKLRLEWL
jgi:hypothetical protein